VRAYIYGEYPCTEKGIVISPGSSRKLWILYDTLPEGTSFDMYELDESGEGLYTYKSISKSCIELKNIGEEPLVIHFIRRFKK
jgi:hypothetical protein